MSIPLKCTVYLAEGVTETQLLGLSLGIDFNFFNFDTGAANFKGIKLIDAGIHFIHFSELNLGIRLGFYLDLKLDHVYFLRWDQDIEKFMISVVNNDLDVVYDDTQVMRKRKIEQVDETSLNVSKWISELPENYQLMINYEQLASQSQFLNKDWEELTSHITMGLVHKIMPWEFKGPIGRTISSLDASKEENEILLDAINDQLSNLKGKLLQDLQSERSKELKFTQIKFKHTFRPNATPLQKSQDSMDKSWYLNSLLQSSNEDLFLGEFQICFINLMLLNNYNSAQQWTNMIKIVTGSFELTIERPKLYIRFFRILSTMLKNLTKELVETDEQDGIVKLYDQDFLNSLKEYQRYIFYEIESSRDVKVLQKSILELFEVFKDKFELLISLDKNEDSEDDEYQPLVVIT